MICESKNILFSRHHAAMACKALNDTIYDTIYDIIYDAIDDAIEFSKVFKHYKNN